MLQIHSASCTHKKPRLLTHRCYVAYKMKSENCIMSVLIVWCYFRK